MHASMHVHALYYHNIHRLHACAFISSTCMQPSSESVRSWLLGYLLNINECCVSINMVGDYETSMIHADRPNAQTSVSDSDTGLPEKFLVHTL